MICCIQDRVLFELQKRKKNSKTKQHIYTEFRVQLEKHSEMTVLLKKAFRDDCLSNQSIKKRHEEFKDGQKSVHNEPQCGRAKNFGDRNQHQQYVSLKTIDICLLEHWWVFWTCKKCQWTKYWLRNSKWNVSMLCWFLIFPMWEQMGFHLCLVEENLKKLQDLDYTYSYVGGAQGDARMPNWPPCLGSPHRACVGTRKMDYTYCERVITVDKSWIHHYNPKLKYEGEMWLQKKKEQKHQKVWQ